MYDPELGEGLEQEDKNLPLSRSLLVRQFFDHDSCSYTYLVADQRNHKAVIIDPVLERVSIYRSTLEDLNLQLMFALDTHVHADHRTGVAALRSLTSCQTALGGDQENECADLSLSDGDKLVFGDLCLSVLATPGHTNDSVCFYVDDGHGHLFSGDTLLIRGTGRTDFQNGDAGNLYLSLHDKLLVLPDSTKVYPGHDYHGRTASTIAEERRLNPRLQWSRDQFVSEMNALKLPHPKRIEEVLPLNKACGSSVEERG